MAVRAITDRPDLAADRAQALALLGDLVSRETLLRLDRFVELFLERQAFMNLVGPATIGQLWTRHIADSLQLLRIAPTAKAWVDLGSGGGFPGGVIACALPDSDHIVHLVESTQKKASFLRDIAHALSLPVQVHNMRIETFGPGFAGPVDIVTARALAPLNRLLGYTIPLLKNGGQGLFMKGQDVEAELTAASKYWNIKADLIPSITDSRGRIVRVWRAQKLSKIL